MNMIVYLFHHETKIKLTLLNPYIQTFFQPKLKPSSSLNFSTRKCIVSKFLFVAVRLVGGSDNATGRVEVYYNGTWGTVCDDDWDIRDARVVCRQLGFQYALNAYENAHYGQGTGPILLDNVACSGSESSLISCSSAVLGSHNCDHSEDAGVQCGNTEGEKN